MMTTSQAYQPMPARIPSFDWGDLAQWVQPMLFNPGAVPEQLQFPPWRTPPFNPGAAPQGYPGGGLLDPIVPPEPPVRGGLLDTALWRNVGEELGKYAARQIKHSDLPEFLHDLPLEPIGGLLGAMLAEYVLPDE